MAGPDPRGSVFRTRTGITASAGPRTASGRRRPASARRPRRAAGSPRTSPRGCATARPARRSRFDAFCEIFLERHGATVAAATQADARGAARLVAERVRQLDAARARGRRRRRRDVAGRASPTRRATGSPRRCGRRSRAAVRWRYMRRNPAVDAGRNPQPRAEELLPFTPEEIDAIDVELGRAYGPLVVVRRRDRACGRTNGSRSSGATSTGGARGRCAAPLRRRRRSRRTRRRHARAARAAHRASARGARAAAAAARHAAPVPGAPRAATSASTTGARASGTRRSTPPGIASAARTTCGTRSRPRRSPPASRPSSSRALMGTSVAMIDRTTGTWRATPRRRSGHVSTREQRRSGVDLASHMNGQRVANLRGSRFPCGVASDGAYRDRTGDLRLAKLNGAVSAVSV